MGAWGPGPFDSDAAADFLDEAVSAPARMVARALRTIARAPSGSYIDVDDGYAAWAAAELVALAFGRGSGHALREQRLSDLAAKVPAWEEYRELAVAALPRIADRATSELAGLRHEGDAGDAGVEGAGFDAALADLRARLEPLPGP